MSLNFPVLESPRLRLVGLDPNAIDDLHAYSIMPEFFTFFEFGPHQTKDQTRRYFEKLRQRSNNETGHYWMIQRKECGSVIGTFGVLDIDLRKASAEIGYGLSPRVWGRGYFSETLNTVLSFLTGEPKLHRIWAKTQSNNINSISALQRAGFVQEGRMRDFYKSEVTGLYHDAIILAFLATEPS